MVLFKKLPLLLGFLTQVSIAMPASHLAIETEKSSGRTILVHCGQPESLEGILRFFGFGSDNDAKERSKPSNSQSEESKTLSKECVLSQDDSHIVIKSECLKRMQFIDNVKSLNRAIKLQQIIDKSPDDAVVIEARVNC